MGKKTRLITMTNKNGMEACIANYGARVVSLCVPDKNGKPTDVVLGFDNSWPRGLHVFHKTEITQIESYQKL